VPLVSCLLRCSRPPHLMAYSLRFGTTGATQTGIRARLRPTHHAHGLSRWQRPQDLPHDTDVGRVNRLVFSVVRLVISMEKPGSTGATVYRTRVNRPDVQAKKKRP